MRTTTCFVVCAAILTVTAISQQLKPILGPPGGSFDRIVLSHASPSVMIARHVRVPDHAPQTIYVTTNGGVNWSAVLTESDGKPLVGPFVHGAEPEFLDVYRGADLLRSADHGQTWQLSDVRTVAAAQLVLTEVVLHPVDASLRFGRDEQRIWYRSRDSGRIWSEIAAPAGDRLFCAASAPATVYLFGEGTLYRSQDTGTSWTAVSGSGAWFRPDDMAVDNVAPSHLVAVWSDTIARSNDGGATWVRTRGLTEATYRKQIKQHPQIPTKWAVWGQFIWGSEDNAATFTVIETELPMIEALDAWNAVIAIACLNDQIRVSQESGNGWYIATGDIRRFSVSSVYDPRRLYVASDRIWYAAGQNDIAKTTDGGETWTFTSPPSPLVPTKDGRILALAATRRQTDLLYASTMSGLLRSTNGGSSWSVVSGLPAAVWTSVAIDPVDQTHLLVGGQQRLMESTNGGQSWIDHSMVLAAPDTVITIKISRKSPLAWIFSAGGGGRRAAVYTTTNAGISFNIARELGAEQVFPDPNDVNLFLATVAGRGDGDDIVHISTDAGMSWNRSTLPPALFYLPGREPTTLRWAVTSRSGVHRQRTDQTWTQQRPDSTIRIIALDALMTDHFLMAGAGEFYDYDPERAVDVSEPVDTLHDAVIELRGSTILLAVQRPMTYTITDVRGRCVTAGVVDESLTVCVDSAGLYAVHLGDVGRIVYVP